MTTPSKADSSTSKIISQLVRDSGAMTVLVITKEGAVIDEAGDVASLNTTAMAALVAGMFSATREVARMVGENQFSILLQQGEKRHIHISLVTDSAMMVIVFEDYQKIGRVRLEARKSGEKLAEELRAAEKTSESDSDLSVPQFKEYALNLIDQIFQTKK